MRILRRLLATPPDDELTQAEFAKLLGVSLRTVRRWEQGYEVGPQHQRALVAIGVNAGWIVGRMQPVLSQESASTSPSLVPAHSDRAISEAAETAVAAGGEDVAVVLRTFERAVYAALSQDEMTRTREGRHCVYRVLMAFAEELRALELGNMAWDVKKAAERIRDGT